MAIRDLKDVWGWIQTIIRRIERLESGAQLGNSSITKGRMRFIGGLLLIDSGGTLQIIGRLSGSGQFVWSGDWRFTGNGAITGDVVAEGKWTQNGAWEFNGPGEIAGNVDVTGDLDLSGDLRVLDDGRVIVGGVTLTPLSGGRVLIGSGSSQIVLDTSQFRVGQYFRMDPTHANGAQMEFGTGRLGRLFGADDQITLTLLDGGDAAAYVAVRKTAAFTGVDLYGEIRTSDLDPLPNGEEFEMIVRSKSTGKLHAYAGGTGGGPGDGIFAWPFPLDLVTSEFRSAQRPNHDGIDFGSGPANVAGTPIPSMGAGVVKTILAEGQGHGWGNGVVIDHGTDPLSGGAPVETLYAHMSTPPVVALGSPVALGQTLGPIGNTGNSFGNHLHLEVHVNGSPVNPRTFMAAHGG